MDTETIKSILRKADPKSNPSAYERRTALTMAQREMDKQGFSYASLGFTQEEAERIANQFAVGSFRGEPKHNTNTKPKSNSTGITKIKPHSNPPSRMSEQSYYRPAPKPEPKKREPYESYEDRCEREDRERWDKWYEGFIAYQASERMKAKENERYMNKVMAIMLSVLVIVAILTFVFVERSM